MATSDTLIRSSGREGEALAPKQARLIRSAYKVMGDKGCATSLCRKWLTRPG